MKDRKVLLLGFGNVNQQLARLLLKKSTSVIAARRSVFPEQVSDLKDNLSFYRADITDIHCLKKLLSYEPDQIVITIAPSEYSENGYRQSYLKAVETLLRACDVLNQQPEVVFVSSSSVYGQNQGEKVNEESECSPTRYNGKVLLETEALLAESTLHTTVVRFAGIYGSGRHRLISMCLKQEIDSQQHQIHWTNRINSEDCARVIDHLLFLPVEQRDAIYLASDNLSVERHRVYNWIRNRFQLPSLNEPDPSSPAILISGKRCDNSRLVRSGFEFKYSDYQDGFLPVIDEYKA